jgi:hypothetical protein
MLPPKKSKIPLKQKIKYAKGYIEGLIKYKLTPPSKESREAKKQLELEKKALEEEFGVSMNKKKKGGTVDKKWIQKAVNPKHKGYCTPMSKPTCTPKRKALARTFKKMAKNK